MEEVEGVASPIGIGVVLGRFAVDNKMRGGFIEGTQRFPGGVDWDGPNGFIRIEIKAIHGPVFVDIGLMSARIERGMWMAVRGNVVYLCSHGRFTKHTHTFERIGNGRG